MKSQGSGSQYRVARRGGPRSPEHDIAKNVDTTRLREMSARRSSIVKLSLVQGVGFIEQSCRM